MKRGFTAASLCAVALAWSLSAEACPGCAAALAARREVWADGFLYNLAAAALPFVVVAAVGARLHRVGAPRPPAPTDRRASGLSPHGRMRRT